jgi:hypothetical protein
MATGVHGGYQLQLIRSVLTVLCTGKGHIPDEGLALKLVRNQERFPSMDRGRLAEFYDAIVYSVAVRCCPVCIHVNGHIELPSLDLAAFQSFALGMLL